jgi:hypothetical protein
MLRVAWEASYRAGTAALARRQLLVAAAVAWRGRCRLSRAGVRLADADHPDLALGRLGPEPRPHCHIVRIQRGRRRCRSALVAGAERPRQHHRRRRSLFRSYWAASFPWRSAQASCLPARWVRIGWSGPQLSDCSPSAPPDFRDPAKWRDAWRIDHNLGKYVISDKPMTEEQWALERADTIDVTPEK